MAENPNATNEMADTGEAKAETTSGSPSAGGGIKPWLPLLLNILLMPALAYAMTTFVLLPKVNGSNEGHASDERGNGHGASDSHGDSDGTVTAALSKKVLVNVAGTKGTRYLLANITLVGGDPALASMVEEHDARLRDIAASVLASKTIADLEKPGARNLVRTELIAAFNGVLGNDSVKELYLTDFAVQ